MQKEDFSELYERAREATQEAQRQGDAQLKAAIEAAAFVPAGTVGSWPLSSMFDNTLLERAYNQAGLLLDKKDVMPIMFQFLLRTTLSYLIFQTRADLSPSMKTGVGPWIAALCATILIVPLHYSSWWQGGRGVVLLLASAFLWFGEVVAVRATYLNLTVDVAHLLFQCIFSTLLHRAPFCSHLKTRLAGFGLQTIGTLAMVSKVYEAIPAMVYFSMSHLLGVALGYMSDQQSRAAFFKSIPHFPLDKAPKDPQISGPQARKRALGGFAGGFAGVSSLKGCPCPPSIWTVSPSSCSGASREDYVSEISCSSSSTVENSLESVSSQHPYSSCLSSSKGGSIGASNSLCAPGCGLECNIYWAIHNYSNRQL